MRDASICGLGQTASQRHRVGARGRAAGVMRIGRIILNPPPRPSRVPQAPPRSRRPVELTIDGQAGDACRRARRSSTPAAPLGIDTPTLCYLENLTPVNVCRVCVVEVAGSRALVPACSRRVEPGMDVQTDSRAGAASAARWCSSSLARRSISPPRRGAGGTLAELWRAPGAITARSAPPRERGERDDARSRASPRRRRAPTADTVAQPVKIDNDSTCATTRKCILCYKCVEACGTDAQNTFAIAVAGRGFDARISTECERAACPTRPASTAATASASARPARSCSRSEYELRAAGTWDEIAQTQTDTICPYCGVGCTLNLHVQDGES